MTRNTVDPKLEALKALGSLNPEPDAVDDELFQSSEFFDRRDLVQVRYEMLRRVRADRRSITETVERFGVSRPTYYRVDADFEKEGLAGLMPRKRGPKDGHKLSAQVVDSLHAALAEDPGLDTRALVRVLELEHGIKAHPRTVERALERRKKKAHRRPATRPLGKAET